MDLTDAKLYILSHPDQIKPFDCGDEDLNSFFCEDALHYSKSLLAVTYVIEKNSEIVAFFSIFNDGLPLEKEKWVSKTQFTKFLREFLPYGKRHISSIPAIKIGRLAVCNTFKKNGLGTIMLNYIKDMAIDLNKKASCKMLLVDAYKSAMPFYEKYGFNILTKDDEGLDTRQMCFDITHLVDKGT